MCIRDRAGATTIYVTHDQVEALTMSTSIAVMKEGVLQQVDAPDAVYRTPANLFVADFVGNPKINLLRGRVASEGVVDLGHFSVQDVYKRQPVPCRRGRLLERCHQVATVGVVQVEHLGTEGQPDSVIHSDLADAGFLGCDLQAVVVLSLIHI